MNILLLFFALPVAIIILSVVLQKILKCPLLVAATFFAILLIIAFTVCDSSFLVFVIVYTILAYVTAVLTRLICHLIRRFNLNNNCNCICDDDDDDDDDDCHCNRCNRRRENVSRGTWRCTTRNSPTGGIRQISANILANDERECSCNRNSRDDTSRDSEPVIVLTNTNAFSNNNGRNGRNGRNCCCGCNRR